MGRPIGGRHRNARRRVSTWTDGDHPSSVALGLRMDMVELARRGRSSAGRGAWRPVLLLSRGGNAAARIRRPFLYCLLVLPVLVDGSGKQLIIPDVSQLLIRSRFLARETRRVVNCSPSSFVRSNPEAGFPVRIHECTPPGSSSSRQSCLLDRATIGLAVA